MPITHAFFDCDDCLYQNNWSTARKISAAIASYTLTKGINSEEAYALYKKHGTCLKGLLAEGLLQTTEEVEDYLLKAHDIDYSDIARDVALSEIVAAVPAARFVFTASTREHATRCMEAGGIDISLFSTIIDTRSVSFESKHSALSFQAAMAAAGATDPSGCVLFDDSVKNIQRAKKMGWHAVLVGLYERDSGKPIVCPEADYHIGSLHELKELMPLLFPAKRITPPTLVAGFRARVLCLALSSVVFALLVGSDRHPLSNADVYQLP